MSKQPQDQIKIRAKAVNLYMTLIGYRERGENVFVFYSPALDLYAYGDDEQTALQAFEETITLYLNYVLTVGTLAEHLDSLGWQRRSDFKTQFVLSSYNPAAIMADKGIRSFHTVGKELVLQT